MERGEDLYQKVERIRRVILTAIGSDDLLADTLVLKGGNALEIAYRIGKRASLDLDFSMEKDFADLEEIRRRLFAALKDRFDSAGFVVFDEKLAARPRGERRRNWGGYRAEFKVISKEMAVTLGNNVEAMRRDSEVLGPENLRIFTIDISKYEYCAVRREFEVDAYQLLVYEPDALAAEKVRALCQQMPEYAQRRHGAPRPRDFYDIYSLVTEADVDFSTEGFRALVKCMFDAKEVPCALIAKIPGQREFHRQQEVALRDSVSGEYRGFDFYFDFTIAEATKLEPLWNP